MADNVFPEEFPKQIADLFAFLYDWFEDRWFPEAYNFGWDEILKSDQFAPLALSVANDGWSVPSEISNLLRRLSKEKDAMELGRQLFLVMCSIDHGLGAYHPSSCEEMPVQRYTIADQYNRCGMYNTDAVPGYVLPRWAGGLREKSYFRACFKNLIRANIDRTLVPLLSRGMGVQERRITQLRIGVIPYLYTIPDDVTFKELDKSGKSYFRLEYPDPSLQTQQNKIKSAVSQLRSLDINIGVFPELALNPSLIQDLQHELKNTDSADSKLVWVVAGSYCRANDTKAIFECYNSAYVFDSSGEVVCSIQSPQKWIQHKRHFHKLTVKDQRKYNIANLFSDEKDRDEAINLGSTLIMFESRSGRFAILICEDFSHDEKTCEYVRKMNCRVLIVLLMNGTMKEGRWFSSRAEFLGDQIGAYVFIANSLLLPLREEGKPRRSREPVGLLLAPEETEGSSFELFQASVIPGQYISEVATLPLIHDF